MRSARTLLAGAAVAAVLTVGTPLAFADGSSDQGKNLTWQEKQDKPDAAKGSDDKKAGGPVTEEHKSTSEHKGGEAKSTESKGEEHKGSESKGSEGREEEHKAPHGGVHTGGGGLVLSGGGLASGAVLLLGGLGAGAYALRRGRRTSGAMA
ncbi:hypothetical protein [Streptomyces sp. NRRL WC-3742]|uniref:hypothetical protein n=1 Tax=Streptomyces sp. NRRL WC-3742 TaxID=1463934 RepID=UPI0004CA8BCB|nr:hypothetical protein [Streptomyces sp. NRRL WC-3742]